jgi:ribosome-associated protein
MPSIEAYELLLAAAAACEDKKAEDIRILSLDPAESGLTDYFLICNGTNDRQNVAITDEIEIRLKRDFGIYPNSVEGRRQGEWILMDYVDFIVHVFSAEKRAFYGLERLRKSATTISVADLNAELKAAVAATRAKATSKTPTPAKPSATPKAITKPATKTPAKSAAKGTAKTAAKTAAKKATPAKKVPRPSTAAKPARTTATKPAAKPAVKATAKKTAAKKTAAAPKTAAKKAASK